MKNLLKKATAMMLALVLLLGLMTAPVHADTPLFTIESENAQLTPDLQVVTSIYGQPKPGFSGAGFVWMQNSGTLTFTVTVPETGMYAISSTIYAGAQCRWQVTKFNREWCYERGVHATLHDNMVRLRFWLSQAESGCQHD